MKYIIHVRRTWPLAPTKNARWEGGARAVLACDAYEIADNGHVCIPDKVAPVLVVHGDNVLAIEERREGNATT